MLRRTEPTHLAHRFRVRLNTDLQYKGEGKTHSGFKEPYTLWSWKQNEIYRAIQENQFEHLRNVYKRQWYEAFRVNADEYIHKYNITKAATLAKWESEMHTQEAARSQVVEREQGRTKLKEKHRDLLKEYHERQFFFWYERASERLQHMSRIKFVTRDNLDAHIEKELNKYVVGAETTTGGPAPYPLNFVGQMPMLETSDLQIASAPRHMAAAVRAELKSTDIGYFEAPLADGAAAGAAAAAADISADVHGLDDDEDSKIAATVLEQLAQEESQLRGKDDMEDLVSNLSDEEYQTNRRKYLDRGATGSKRRDWKKGGSAKHIESISSSPSVAEAEGTMKEAAVKGKAKAKRDAKKSKKQQKIDDAQAAAASGAGAAADEESAAAAMLQQKASQDAGGRGTKMAGKIKKDRSAITEDLKQKLHSVTKDERSMFSKIRGNKPAVRK